MIHRPRWLCACFAGEAPFCNDCSLGEWSGLWGAGANHLAQSLRKPCSPAHGSAELLWRAVWMAEVLGLLRLCAHSLCYSCLFCVTRALGMASNLPRSIRPSFYWKKFQNEKVPWDDWRSQKNSQKRHNMKQKGSPRFGVLDHWLLSIREDSISHKLLPLQDLNTDAPPCPQSLQSSVPRGKFLSYRWPWECEAQAQSGIKEAIVSGRKKEGVGIQGTRDSILSLSEWPWSSHWTHVFTRGTFECSLCPRAALSKRNLKEVTHVI